MTLVVVRDMATLAAHSELWLARTTSMEGELQLQPISPSDHIGSELEDYRSFAGVVYLSDRNCPAVEEHTDRKYPAVEEHKDHKALVERMAATLPNDL